jgi:hypothetical protein
MFNVVDFKRAEGGSVVGIAPVHVVKIERGAQAGDGQSFTTRLTLVSGAPELVEGSPSEVTSRLRRGN